MDYLKRHLDPLILGVLFGLISFLIPPPIFGVSHSSVADQESHEYVLKAGFIYNFTKFIQWPGKANQEINQKGMILCLAGEDPFGEVLEQLAQKLRLKSKDLVVRPRVALEEMSGCHILFVGPSEQYRLGQILDRVKNYPVLVIGDTPGYAKKGVGINFVVRKNKIRFEINREAVEQAGLRVSAELLNLATIVQGRGM